MNSDYGPVLLLNSYASLLPSLAFIMPASGDAVIHVQGLFELRGHSGGASQSPDFVYLGGTADGSDRLSIVLHLLTTGDNYFLNHLETPPGGYPTDPKGVEDLAYTFTIASANFVAGEAATVLAVIPEDVFWEPRDPATEDWLLWEKAGQEEVSQFLFVDIVSAAPTNNAIKNFRFSGFVDNIRQSGSR